jgi:hypothetical protein
VKIKVEVEEKAAAEIHHLIQLMRALPQVAENETLNAQLRDAEFAFSGALRSHGWMPQPGDRGGWMKLGRR